ncbi:MAG: presqualene diphosphate synthase HpnD [Gammaproteobacteria bacterium]|nr:presqualene diphosphate synthase HpnD [Gammaproteobacteria bacterium]
MTPDQYCQQKTLKSGSSFYFSFLFLPPAQRQAMNALYAFCREVDDVVDETHDPAIARIKLQWWREELVRCYQGQAQHPVGQAIQTLLPHYDLPQALFEQIIDGMQMDLEQNRYADFASLSGYCYRVAGVVGLLSSKIFGYQHADTEKYAVQLGLALQLTNIIRDVREDAQRGRIYLPQDEMQRFGVSESSILALEESDALKDLLQFQAQRALQQYDMALQTLPEEDRQNQRTAMIMATIYRHTLELMIKQDLKVMQRRISLPVWKKLWLAWRTARLEHGLRKQHLRKTRA